jgi:hypothetical protein
MAHLHLTGGGYAETQTAFAGNRAPTKLFALAD